jgi:hypothetical protein
MGEHETAEDETSDHSPLAFGMFLEACTAAPLGSPNKHFIRLFILVFEYM